MKKIKILTLLSMALTSIFFIASCKKDAVVDGGVSNEKVDATTYDFLKNHYSKQFDTTMMIIDKAGMKDVINSSGTFFVPNNYAINNFLRTKRDEARQYDERKNYTLDSLYKYYTPKMLRDTMSMYFFPQKIVRDMLNSGGTIYPTSTANFSLNVSLETYNDYTNGINTIPPKLIYISKIIGAKDVFVDSKWIDPTGNTKLNDVRSVCQTTGIITNTGVVHVLSSLHTWSFYTLKPKP